MHTAPPQALMGGSIFLGYNLILEFLRHHDETNLRPKFIDHVFATTIIGGLTGAAMFGGSTRHIVTGMLVGGFTIGWPLWWCKQQGMRPGAHAAPAGVFYTDDASKDDIERITHQDLTEMLAAGMIQKPGYGLIQQDQRFI